MGEKELFDKMYNTCVDIVRRCSDLTQLTGRSQVACALQAGSGHIYTGLNIGWWHSTCAEATALSNAWQNGERKVNYIMAVKLNWRNDQIESLPPCGICREMFNTLQPETKIVYVEDGQYVVKTIDEMLPDIEKSEEEIKRSSMD